jgi:hypothetical protein
MVSSRRDHKDSNGPANTSKPASSPPPAAAAKLDWVEARQHSLPPSPQLHAFVKLLARVTRIPLDNIDCREIVCTPCGGNYEQVAYWLIAVNGSPPCGTIVYDPEVEWAYLIACKPRRLGDEQTRVVKAFLEHYCLRDRYSDEALEAGPVVVWDREAAARAKARYGCDNED